MILNIYSHCVCFTGHRKIPSEQYSDIAGRLKNILIELIQQGVTVFLAGGAQGFDTIAAQTVLGLKNEYPQTKLILVLPCITQTRGWDKRAISVYENIKAQCDKTIYVSNEYREGCMLKRNRYLADHSSVCVCYMTDNKGGTGYTVRYAHKKGLRIINIA